MLLLAAVAAFAVLSCQKNETTAENALSSDGIPMTLTAGFGDLTKVTYSPDGNVLKTSWEATENISVITLDATSRGNIVAIDNFTSTGAAGRADAVFTGTFTGGTSPDKVIAIYPALSQQDGGEYVTAPYSTYIGGKKSFISTQINNMYLGTSNEPLKQAADNDASHLQNYCIMSGVVGLVDIQSGTLSVDLFNQMTVLKATITLPDAAVGKKLTEFQIKAAKSDDSNSPFAKPGGWEYADICYDPLFAPGSEYSSQKSLYLNNITVTDTKTLTLYMPNSVFANQEAGNKWIFTAYDSDSNTYTATKDFSAAASFERGKIYRISATLN